MVTVLPKVRSGNYNPGLLQYHKVMYPRMLSSIFRYLDFKKIRICGHSSLNTMSASFKSQMLHTKWTEKDLDLSLVKIIVK